MSLENNKLNFRSVDILRGFAAVSVVVYHVIELWNWGSFPTTGVLTWFRIGWMSVDLFFVISGFVIALSAFSEIEKSGEDFRKPFFRRRLIRIVPLHYLTILLFISLVMPELLFEKLLPNLLTHIFFVHNLSIQYQGAIDGANWSLAAEMQFYLLVLLIGPWIRKTRLLNIILSFIGITWLWRLGVILIVKPSNTLGTFPVFVWSTQLPGMLDEFAAGILLARFVRSDIGKRIISFLRSNVAGVGVLFLAGLSLFAVLSLYWQYASFWDHPLMVIFFRTLLSFAFMLIVFAACLFNPSGLVYKVLSPFYYLGTISYGIYLWHLLVINSLKRIQWLQPTKALPYTIVLTIILAAVSWHFFEHPLIERLGKRKPNK